MNDGGSIDAIGILLRFAGGLGLFIYGMRLMGDGLQKAAGAKLKKLIEILTTNRFFGLVVGTVVTALIQSSSATTVMVVGFVNAGLMNLTQATGIIMGANIGTTITAQLIAFNLTQVAPLAILIGVSMILFSKKRNHKRIGEIAAGFGILFFGMGTMSGAVEPLRENQAFVDIIMKMENPFLGVLAGFAITVLLQSSSASIGILQALAFQNLITIDVAIPILFGENIGTCVTALISSVGTCKTARRAAVIHLLINTIGTCVFLLIISFVPFTDFIRFLSAEPSRQIAHAHTVFNITNTIILFPFAGILVKLSKSIITGANDKEQKGLKFLDMRILETPSIAVFQASKEGMRLAGIVVDNFKSSMDALFNEDENTINRVLETEKTINYLNGELTHYLVKISELSLSSDQALTVNKLFHTVDDLERVGDHAENMAELAQYKMDNKLRFSETALEQLHEMNDRVMDVLTDAIKAFETGDKKLAETVEPREDEIDNLEIQLRNSHIKRLNKGKCDPSSGVIFLDIVNNLERVADHSSNIAYTVLGKLDK